MPTMANITVKNKAGTDVIYVAKVPSAGDRTPAQWMQDAASGVVQYRPAFAMGTKNSGDGRKRIADINAVFPVTVTENGIVKLADKIVFQGSFQLSKTVDTVANEEAIVQFGNLLVSTLIRQALTDGYAPT